MATGTTYGAVVPTRLRPTRRRIVRGVAATLAVALAVVAGIAFLPMRATREVTVPPDDASPEQVATAYLDSIAAHDCDTAHDLLVADPGPERGFCGDVRRLSGIEVRAARPEVASAYGQPSDAEAVSVTVRFDFTWRWLRYDGSMEDGVLLSSMGLTRDSPDAPWRVAGFGQG